MEPKEKMIAALERLFKDEKEIVISMSAASAWCLCGAVQLASRHPEWKGESHSIATTAAKKILDAICASDSDLRLLAEMGWNERFDVQ